MLSFEDTLNDQNNLVELCSDRRLKTRETIRLNAYYGIDRILKQFARLPLGYSLKCVVPHGVSLNPDFIPEAELDVKLPEVHCFPPYRASTYRKKTEKHVILSASPYLYALELLRPIEQLIQRKGTLFFPQHSTRFVTAHMNFNRIAERLSELDDQFKPISICVYWRDYNLGHHLPFVKKGFQIVSAGHMYDQDFLFRLHHLLSRHRFAAGNGFGSHIFYAIKSGCRYFHLPDEPASHEADEDSLRRFVSEVPPTVATRFKDLFDLAHEFDVSMQNEIADYHLGTGFMKSPQELRKQFLHAELVDKTGFAIFDEGEGMRWVGPTFYRRVSLEMEQRASKSMKKLITKLQKEVRQRKKLTL